MSILCVVQSYGEAAYQMLEKNGGKLRDKFMKLLVGGADWKAQAKFALFMLASMEKLRGL